ncbi:MAG TPA: TonB-dependent receptor [Cyclobacteriaceae bacterium]|nr:TonB-dependent receptor [Cyclobacteriaceae bacterium]HRJ81952.1 TonB-dependent receptor [Cyclobacteriaceae bacterium]
MKSLFILFSLISAICLAQSKNVTISGLVKDRSSQEPVGYVNVVLFTEKDSTFVSGTVSADNGRFSIPGVSPGNYFLELSFVGYTTKRQSLYVGTLTDFLDLSSIELVEDSKVLAEVVVTSGIESVSGELSKQTYRLSDNISQQGGSVLQAMQNLPGVTVDNGKLLIRGNEKVVILIDGKQTALTGFGNQSGLDNLPASAIDRIEIINNPSSKYDANGNAGIINIILKKEDQYGLNGKAGLSAGIGALWVREENLPGIRPQYQSTPKINPSLSLNYRKEKTNFFLQADNLYTETLNKNEFVTRTYNDGTVINQQLKRNRNTNVFNSNAGIDWFINDQNTLTVSGLFSQESIKDYGDQPFFSGNTGESLRLWQFLEDEVLTAVMASVAYEHKFLQPGHKLNLGLNYTFDREDEKYFFTNTTPSFTTEESFFLIADQKVLDFTLDYTKPLKHGLLETGFKFRRRTIPTDMQFNPSPENSVLDTGADGKATYTEVIPALYGNYIYEVRKLEAEIGLRIEYVNLKYDVDPNHNTYQSDGYSYFQPFPNARLTYKINDRNRLSAFFNRRVDRPDEVDIRIFPKYDDAEIIKVGNPALLPQFTNSIELGYKTSWDNGYIYIAAYHRFAEGTITRIASIVPGSNLIYATTQNAGKSYNTGIELTYNQDLLKWYSFNLTTNAYRNQINAFSVENKYPEPHTFSAELQKLISGNIKWNNLFRLKNGLEGQVTLVYLARDIIPQGEIASRYSVDLGIKKSIQKGKGELFFNATDLFNTLVIKKEIQGTDFSYTSEDYFETQVIRAGYSYKF